MPAVRAPSPSSRCPCFASHRSAKWNPKECSVSAIPFSNGWQQMRANLAGAGRGWSGCLWYQVRSHLCRQLVRQLDERRQIVRRLLCHFRVLSHQFVQLLYLVFGFGFVFAACSSSWARSTFSWARSIWSFAFSSFVNALSIWALHGLDSAFAVCAWQSLSSMLVKSSWSPSS